MRIEYQQYINFTNIILTIHKLYTTNNLTYIQEIVSSQMKLLIILKHNYLTNKLYI